MPGAPDNFLYLYRKIGMVKHHYQSELYDSQSDSLDPD